MLLVYKSAASFGGVASAACGGFCPDFALWVCGVVCVVDFLGYCLKKCATHSCCVPYQRMVCILSLRCSWPREEFGVERSEAGDFAGTCVPCSLVGQVAFGRFLWSYFHGSLGFSPVPAEFAASAVRSHLPHVFAVL
jgi:hypothetical protein